MKVIITILKVVTSIIIGVLVFVLFSAIHLSQIRRADLKSQNKRMDKLEASYENYEPSGYLKYSGENLDELAFNEVSFLASHNSYKKKGSLVGKLFVGLGDSFSEAKALNYSYKTITEQLKSGIFSFELDVRLRKDEFEITHVPLVDNSSTAVNFENALLEYKYFLEQERDAFPILVLLEIKDDYMFLDPSLKNIENDELTLLEDKIEVVLGDYLYTPEIMVGEYSSIKDRLDDKGWPKISELKGKIMFLIHAGKYANSYLELNKQKLFSATYKDNLNSNAPFIIHNNLDVESINSLVNSNYMVRTRIGDTLNYTLEDLEKALNSRAQILTSDFTVARSDINKYLYLDENKTIRGNNDQN